MITVVRGTYRLLATAYRSVSSRSIELSITIGQAAVFCSSRGRGPAVNHAWLAASVEMPRGSHQSIHGRSHR